MGNHKFRFSDMMPNAWFYKLKDIGGGRRRRGTAPPPPPPAHHPTSYSISNSKMPPPPPKSYPRKSYYYTRNLTSNSPISTPRKSKSLNRTKTVRYSSPKLVTSSVSANCTCRHTNKSSDYSASSSSYTSMDSDLIRPDDSFRSDRVLPTESSFDKMVARSYSNSNSNSNSNCGCDKTADDDIIINVDSKSFSENFGRLELSDLDLPPIITKPASGPGPVQVERTKKKNAENTKHRKSSVREEPVSTRNRRHVTSPGLRLRVNSPRIANRRIGGRKSVSSSSSSSSRRSLSESLAVVKSSIDPQKDFRESMVEMIVENNIKTSKDLEDLLACYLQLNADEYHEMIIKVFKQIWFDLTETPAKCGP
ncbi:Transcription repressor OFP2 [Euphorbia peplus]|nr:Transcription repressor OFP2 [Euphorbia peplus]